MMGVYAIVVVIARRESLRLAINNEYITIDEGRAPDGGEGGQ